MRAADPAAQAAAVALVRDLAPPGVHVGTFYPRSSPEEALVVTRAGGVMATPITDAATISIRAYAGRQERAEELIGQVRLGLTTGDWPGTRTATGHLLRGWGELAGPVRLPDPDHPELVRFQYSGRLLVSILRR